MWLHIPTTTSAFAPARACSTSDLNLHWRLARFCTLRGKHRLPRYWRHACGKAHWLKRLSGLTCPQSQQHCSVALWTVSLAASRVKATVSPANANSKTTHETSGRHSGNWCKTWEHGGWRSRMSQASLFPTEAKDDGPQSKASLETWPKQGGLRNGRIYKRKPLAVPTSESGTSSWPAVTANTATYTRDGGDPAQQRMALNGAAKLWSTPRTITGGGESAERKKELGRQNAGGGDLQAQAEMWQTPNGSDAGNQSRDGKRKNELLLAGQAKAHSVSASAWPTPRASDHKGADSKGHHVEKGYLTGAAEQTFYQSQRPDPQTQAGQTSSPSTRRLNPRFTEWLMMFPPGWTSVAPNALPSQAMVSYRCRLQRLFTNLHGG